MTGNPEAHSALERLCRDYYGPVKAFLHSRRFPTQDVEDFTHDFFSELVKTHAWKRADRTQGRFRTFLLAILLHVIGRHRERAQALKRGSALTESFEELAEAGFEVAASPQDTSVFDREWALVLMENTVRAVERSFAQTERSAQWEVLCRFLPGSGEAPTYEEAAAQLGISLAAVKSGVHRLRLQFREELRFAVARTVGAAHEVDEELAYLHRVLTSAEG